MTTRSFTIAALWIAAEDEESLWGPTEAYTVLVKYITAREWGGQNATLDVRLYGPAGGFSVLAVPVTAYAVATSAPWLVISPGLELRALTAGTTTLGVSVHGTLLPAGPGLARVGTLPAPPPGVEPHARR